VLNFVVLLQREMSLGRSFTRKRAATWDFEYMIIFFGIPVTQDEYRTGRK
jgi:hypothetical protein